MRYHLTALFLLLVQTLAQECFKENVKIKGRLLTREKLKKETAKLCFSLCKGTDGCMGINYYTKTYAKERLRKRCFLYKKIKSNKTQQKSGTVSAIMKDCEVSETVCNSTSGMTTLMGVCLTQQQCSKAAGSNLGTCACEIGVCCKITKNSGTLNSKVGYIENTGYPSTTTTAETTTINIEVTDPDVCQIRLDFDSFEMAKPETHVPSNCLTESLAVTSTLFTPNNLGVKPLCGINTGQHMYIGDFDITSTPTTVATLAAISTVNPSKWSIKVTQVDCKATDAFSQNIRAPSGCRQYYTADTGTIKSYNYGNDGVSMYSSDQDYLYCIKRNPTDCQIKYVKSSTAPAKQTSVGSQTYISSGTAVPGAATCYNTAVAATVVNACGSGPAGCIYPGIRVLQITDYLQIPGANYDGGSGTSYTQDFFCGNGIGWASTTDAGTGVVSQAAGPFQVRFHAGTDLPEGCTPDLCRLGFNLDYTKATTCQTLLAAGALPSTRIEPYKEKKTYQYKVEKEKSNTVLLKLLTEINNIKKRIDNMEI